MLRCSNFKLLLLPLIRCRALLARAIRIIVEARKNPGEFPSQLLETLLGDVKGHPCFTESGHAPRAFLIEDDPDLTPVQLDPLHAAVTGVALFISLHMNLVHPVTPVFVAKHVWSGESEEIARVCFGVSESSTDEFPIVLELDARSVKPRGHAHRHVTLTAELTDVDGQCRPNWQ